MRAPKWCFTNSRSFVELLNDEVCEGSPKHALSPKVLYLSLSVDWIFYRVRRSVTLWPNEDVVCTNRWGCVRFHNTLHLSLPNIITSLACLNGRSPACSSFSKQNISSMLWSAHWYKVTTYKCMSWYNKTPEIFFKKMSWDIFIVNKQTNRERSRWKNSMKSTRHALTGHFSSSAA